MNGNTSGVPTRFPGPVAHTVGDVGEEPYPSLSDYHDYEPNLEFDDTELQHTPTADIEPDELLKDMEENGMASPVSDFTDENFEDELAETCEENFDSLVSSYPEVGSTNNRMARFNKIAKYGIVDVKGDDNFGHKIIVVYACKLPPSNEINHDHLLEYLIYTLDKYVEQDYMLIYFHYGLNSKNKPSIRWLWQAYRAFDRKYKKNLKALYMVHPTGFVKFISQMFRPVISVKFGKKLNYMHSLAELNRHISEHISLDQLSIPEEVKFHDRSETTSSDTEISIRGEAAKTRQFGVTLAFIKTNYRVTIPPVVKACIEYLDNPAALETEGIFRRSPGAVRLKYLKNIADRGEPIIFQDPHEAAVLLKTFLKELKEPLLTFDLYEEIVSFQTWDKNSQLRRTSILVMEKLPEDNYKILKYIITFLTKVMEWSDLNKMNASNLAVVFGPNLIWSDNVSMSLKAIGPINTFTQFLLQHRQEIFMI